MKKARYVLVAILGICVYGFGAKADPDPAATEQANNPYTQYDADGVPLILTQPQGSKLSPDDIAAMHREESRASRDKDWLMRGYEKQLQSHASTSGDNQGANLYYELSTNKQLAKLAGLPDPTSDDHDTLSTYRTGTPQPDHNSDSPGNDSISSTATSSIGKGFRPLITPLSAPEAAGFHNFYSSSLSVVQPFYANAVPSAPPAPKPDADPDDPQDLDTPGMVASKNDPLADPAMSDLTLDVLPDESIEHARAHQDHYDATELPLPMDSDQLHKTETSSLNPQNEKNATKTTAQSAQPLPTAPMPDPEAPTPVSKLPQINPVHAPIASPFDILDR